MKLKYLCVALSASLLGLAACQPDEYSLGGASYTPDDLQQGINYSVTPDAQNPNIIHLSTSVKGVIPSWILTDGATSQKSSLDLNLPFAGEYSVTFGVTTEAGVIYGEPYKFTVKSNDFTMLDNELWSYLAGGVGKTKKWVPVDKDYGVGQCTGPVMYCNPDDVMNDQSGSSNLSFKGFVPNWDPGFQDWLIPATSPYMNSYMEFGLDAAKGCTLTMVRGDEDGKKYSGSFGLNLDDASHPTISFNGGTFALHNTGLDEACSNYTKDIQIVELTPYILQLATMRTNEEGAWWLIWNFVAEDVKNGSVDIPVEEKPVETADVEPIDDLDLASSLFQIVTDDATYQANSLIYLINEEQPYGFYWWNGGVNNADGKSPAWQASNAADYGKKAWYPEAKNAIADFALTLSLGKDNDGNEVYKFYEENADVDGTFTIDGNTLTFSQPVSFITADSVSIETDVIEVVKADPTNNEFFFAVPLEKNANGKVSKYAYAFLTQKSIGGGEATGPKVLKVDQSKVDWSFGDTQGKALRITILNTWGNTAAVDPSQIKLKKGKTMKVTFKITSGITWKEGAEPKAILRHNVKGLGVGADWFGFGEADAVVLNKDGETTLVLTNNTDSAADFTNGGSGGSLQIVVQIDSQNKETHDMCEIAFDEEGKDPVITGEVSITIE